MPNTETSVDVENLVKLSIRLWDIVRYYQTVAGPANLEMDLSKGDLLKEIATMVDNTLVTVIPVEKCVIPSLRRAVVRKGTVELATCSQAG